MLLIVTWNEIKSRDPLTILSNMLIVGLKMRTKTRKKNVNYRVSKKTLRDERRILFSFILNQHCFNLNKIFYVSGNFESSKHKGPLLGNAMTRRLFFKESSMYILCLSALVFVDMFVFNKRKKGWTDRSQILWGPHVTPAMEG